MTITLGLLLLASLLVNIFGRRRVPEVEPEPIRIAARFRTHATFFPLVCRRALVYDGMTDCCARSATHYGRCMCQLEIDHIADNGSATIVPVTSIEAVAFDDETIA